MSDELEHPTGTTEDTTGTTGQPADGSGDPQADGSGELSAEELSRKLREVEQRAAEAERKNQQLLSEKSRVEAERAAAREALSRAGTPPTPQVQDPFAEELAALVQIGAEAQAALANDPTNVQLRAQAVSIATQLRATQRDQARWQQEMRFQAMRAELMQVPEAIRAKVAEKLDTGAYSTVQSAREAVEGITASTELESVRAKMAELEKELARLKDNPTVDVGTSLRGTGAPVGGREITMAEYQRLLRADDATAKKAEADYEAGRIRLRT